MMLCSVISVAKQNLIIIFTVRNLRFNMRSSNGNKTDIWPVLLGNFVRILGRLGCTS